MSEEIICPVARVACERGDCTATQCGHLRNKAKAHLEKVMHVLETQYNGDQQARVIECGLRLRDLAYYYGPYFTLAMMLTGAEIAAGALTLPEQAEFDRTDLMLPGGKTVGDLSKIVLPDGVKH